MRKEKGNFKTGWRHRLVPSPPPKIIFRQQQPKHAEADVKVPWPSPAPLDSPTPGKIPQRPRRPEILKNTIATSYNKIRR